MARAKKEVAKKEEPVQVVVEEVVVEEPVQVEAVEEKPTKKGSFDAWWKEKGVVMFRDGHAARGLVIIALHDSDSKLSFQEVVAKHTDLIDLIKANDAEGAAKLAYNAK